MSRMSLLVAVLILCPFSPIRAQQDAVAEREREAVKRVVETYLYAEGVEEVKSVSDPQAKIITPDDGTGRIRETLLSKPAGKRPRGARTTRNPQKIVAIDIADGVAASVKVVTELITNARPPAAPPHFQYLSLLKLNGQWKIVGVLMPSISEPILAAQ